MFLRSLIFKSTKSLRVYLLNFQLSAASSQAGAARMVRIGEENTSLAGIFCLYKIFQILRALLTAEEIRFGCANL